MTSKHIVSCTLALAFLASAGTTWAKDGAKLVKGFGTAHLDKQTKIPVTVKILGDNLAGLTGAISVNGGHMVSEQQIDTAAQKAVVTKSGVVLKLDLEPKYYKHGYGWAKHGDKASVELHFKTKSAKKTKAILDKLKGDGRRSYNSFLPDVVKRVVGDAYGD